MKKILLSLLFLNLVAPNSYAMVLKSKVIRSRAVQKKIGKDTFASLDLKENNLRFTKQDQKFCRSTLIRNKKSLVYECRFKLPTKSNSAILSEVRTNNKLKIKQGKLNKKVTFHISKDAKMITFFLKFDQGVFDLDYAEFNTEGFQVFNEMASQIMEKAIAKAKIQYLTLQN